MLLYVPEVEVWTLQYILANYMHECTLYREKEPAGSMHLRFHASLFRGQRKLVACSAGYYSTTSFVANCNGV